MINSVKTQLGYGCHKGSLGIIPLDQVSISKATHTIVNKKYISSKNYAYRYAFSKHDFSEIETPEYVLSFQNVASVFPRDWPNHIKLLAALLGTLLSCNIGVRQYLGSLMFHKTFVDISKTLVIQKLGLPTSPLLSGQGSRRFFLVWQRRKKDLVRQASK